MTTIATIDEGETDIRQLSDTAITGLMGLVTKALMKLGREAALQHLDMIDNGTAALAFRVALSANGMELLGNYETKGDAQRLFTLRFRLGEELKQHLH